MCIPGRGAMRSRRGFDLAMAAEARRAASELRLPPPPTSSATRSMAGRGGRAPFPRGRRARARAASATRLSESGSEPASSPRPRRWFASGLRRSSGTRRQREGSRSPGGRRRPRHDPRRSLFPRGQDVPTELSRPPCYHRGSGPAHRRKRSSADPMVLAGPRLRAAQQRRGDPTSRLPRLGSRTTGGGASPEARPTHALQSRKPQGRRLSCRTRVTPRVGPLPSWCRRRR